MLCDRYATRIKIHKEILQILIYSVYNWIISFKILFSNKA